MKATVCRERKKYGCYHSGREVPAWGKRRDSANTGSFVPAMRALPALAVMLATVGMILICTLSYRSIRTSASSGFKYYTSVTVESGMTLWGLADEYIDYNYYKDRDSYIAEVKSINHLDDNGSLIAGQMLVLPYYSNEYIP